MALTTYEEILKMVRDEFEQLSEREYPEELLHEFADSECPVYYHDISTEWVELPMEDTDRWQEIGAEGHTTIYQLMSLDLYLYYQTMFQQAWEQVKEEKEFQDA